MSEATNNLLPPAVSPQVMTRARWLAKRAVKAAWLRQGFKPQYLDASDIARKVQDAKDCRDL